VTRLLTVLLIVAALVGWINTGSASAAVPLGFEDTLVAGGIPAPTALAFTPDRRLLITSQSGKLRVYASGTLLTAPALDFTDKICSNLERGLLGVAVDPAFQANHHIYLYYTFNKLGACDDPLKTPVNRVSRFTLSDANVVQRASELILIDNIPSPQGQHNAGDLHFGKDNYLYVSIGDGNCDYAADSGCGPFNNAARDTHVLLGKILRIASGGGVPPTNPFLGPDSARCNVAGRTTPGKKCQETYASGLRNPFRFAVDPNAAGTRFFVNDVGHATWEEIDLGRRGADYGWNVREGHCARASTTDCGPPPAGMTNPIFDYAHSTGCTAITGGAFVPNQTWPAQYSGGYLFSDYACGKLFILEPSGTGGYAASEFATDVRTPVAMTFGPHGATQALYYTTYSGSGQVRRVAFTGSLNRAPVAKAVANPAYGDVPLSVTFDASGSSDPEGDPLTYQWDFGDGTPGAGGPKPSHTYSQAGTYTATVRVFDNRGAVGTARLRIDAGNHPPSPRIELPMLGSRFRVGQTITLRGSAVDPEDGTLPAGALQWTVTLRHNTHTHPFLGPVSGNDITFRAPAPEDLAAATTTDLRIRLTAADSRGLRASVSQTLRPRTVDLRFETAPPGLKLKADVFLFTAPRTLVSWEGYRFRVNAPTQTDGSGQRWTFSSWSDGKTAVHDITTPSSATTYRATFTR
jgi:glucose/arabinose dehydrogenase